jgi:hypothetical protein
MAFLSARRAAACVTPTARRVSLAVPTRLSTPARGSAADDVGRAKDDAGRVVRGRWALG